ncbi:MAG TPA: manganese efflux pump [bacterium]|nr:manganese efflux pump [bacterium]
METLSIFAIAAGLAMDAFAVSVSTGIKLGCSVKIHHTFRLAFNFGFFQFIMTVLGWYSGYSVERIIKAYDHWIAMALLVFIGVKMIFDSFRNKEYTELECDPTKGINVLILSIATSIDAFAVGLSLGVLNLGIWYPSIIIGLVAAVFTIIGMKLGSRVGIKFSHRTEILGGIILIGIGIKIFVEHIIASI